MLADQKDGCVDIRRSPRPEKRKQLCGELLFLLTSEPSWRKTFMICHISNAFVMSRLMICN